MLSPRNIRPEVRLPLLWLAAGVARGALRSSRTASSDAPGSADAFIRSGVDGQSFAQLQHHSTLALGATSSKAGSRFGAPHPKTASDRIRVERSALPSFPALL